MDILALANAHPYLATGLAAVLALKLPLPKLPNLVEALFRATLGAAFGWVFPKYYVDNDGSSYIVSFLEHNSRSFGPTQHHFSNSREYIRPIGRVGTVWGSVVNSRSRLFWFCGRPIWYNPQRAKDGGNGTEKPYYQTLRWTVNWPRLLELAGEHADRKISEHADGVSLHKIVNHVGSKRGAGEDQTVTKSAAPNSTPDIMGATIRRLLHWKPEDLGFPPGQQEMDVLSFTPGMVKVVRDVGFFVRNRKWYEERQIPWRRGYLLYGKPGTGKTSLVRALSEQLDIPIHIFNLATMDDHDFLKAWAAARTDSRKIVLLEDFDTIFHLRENVSNRCTLSFQTVLNCIDGIERNNGLMLFITTNEVDKIDEAIGAPNAEGDSSRPGRVDLIAHMEAMGPEGRYKIAFRVFKDEAKARAFASEERGESASQFTGRCILEAQRELWARYDGGGPVPGTMAKNAAERRDAEDDAHDDVLVNSYVVPDDGSAPPAMGSL